jgi:hypothetical protein
VSKLGSADRMAAAIVHSAVAEGHSSPVEQLSRRLRALSPDDPDRYGVQGPVAAARGPVSPSTGSIPVQYPGAPGELPTDWLPVADPVAVIAEMCARKGEHLSISPAVAGARIAGSLGWAAAGRPAVALAVTGQVYDTGPASLLVRLTAAGLVERIAVRSPLVAALAGARPAAGVQVQPDLAALTGWAAERIHATLAPLIAELHRVTRYRLAPMWDQVADAVLGPATVAAGLAGLDQRAGRASGLALIGALIEAGAPIRRIGTVRELVVEGQLDLQPVRGSCCLSYRQDQKLCASCPLTHPPVNR